MPRQLLHRALAAAAAITLFAIPAQAPAASQEGDPALQQIEGFIASQKIDKSKSGWKEHLSKPPLVEDFDKTKSYLWDLETNQGKIVVKLMPAAAPMHVTSTIYLTKLGFYDDIVFHRVITGFMAQGGDPTGTGRGGPGYEYAGEFDPKVTHDRPHLLSMANRGPGTDGSQFFLTFVPTPWLDGKHTIFGEVVGGQDVVKKLEGRGSKSGKTAESLLIEKATIRVE